MSKVIVITGASSGIGKETARQLIAEGHKVYVAARRVDQMQDLVQAGGVALPLDIMQEENIQQVVDTIIEREGKIDVLFNNAGYAIYGSVEEIPIQEARQQFEVNLFGLASLTQKVIPYMRQARSGTIINTSSMGGKMYTPMGAWYHASKHAIEGWSDCLRLELSQFNIQVVVLEPGLIATEFADVMSGPMVARSGNGPYARIVKGLVNSSATAMSPATVIAETVSAIVRTNRPRTRYRVGKWARPMVWMRIYLGDRLFDRIIMSQVK